MSLVRHDHAVDILGGATLPDLLDAGVTLAEIAGVTAASLMMRVANDDYDAMPPNAVAGLLNALAPYAHTGPNTNVQATVDVNRMLEQYADYRKGVDGDP